MKDALESQGRWCYFCHGECNHTKKKVDVDSDEFGDVVAHYPSHREKPPALKKKSRMMMIRTMFSIWFRVRLTWHSVLVGALITWTVI